MSFLVCTYGEIACSRPCLTECWILEKVLKFAQQFSRPGKSLENGDSRDKVWKNGFFQSYDECFIIFFGFGQILIDLAHTLQKKLCSCDFYDLYWSPIW